MAKNKTRSTERIFMKNIKKMILAAIAGLFIMACAEKEPVFPWINDVNTVVEANGRIVGYEIYAKW